MENKPILTPLFTAKHIIDKYNKKSSNNLSLWVNCSIVLFFLAIIFALFTRYNKKNRRIKEKVERKKEINQKIKWLHDKIKKQDEEEKNNKNEHMVQKIMNFSSPPHLNIPNYDNTIHIPNILENIKIDEMLHRNSFSEFVNNYQV